LAVQPNKAIVGKNAFAHEAGIHQDGILKMRQTYEIIDPCRIGRESHELVLGKHSGRHAFREKLKNMGFALKPQMFDETFERFKKLADMKKSIYDEDIEALVEDELTQIPEIWKFKSIALCTETGRKPEAVIVLEKKKKEIKAASSGDGPVDACFRAIDKITKIRSRLLEYSLEAVSPGEDALGEVKVKVRVGREEISGRGASTDIIEASVKAYLNALNRSRSRVLPKKTLRPPGRMI
jgi:2-isopropylmalate synthase